MTLPDLPTRQLAILAALYSATEPLTTGEVWDQVRPLCATAVRSTLYRMERRGLVVSSMRRSVGAHWGGWERVWWRA